jgi:DNA-binding transcriptional LysR family regulator
MGVSLVPEMAVDKSRPCRFVRIADTQAERTIAAVVLRGRTLNRGSRALLAHLG